MPYHTEIRKLIKGGENEKVEFKMRFGDETIETITSFANATGGSVIVGINNSGQIIGINIGKETIQSWVNEIKNKTSPAQTPEIIEHKIDDKLIYQIKINEFPVKPVAFKGRYFKRIKNSNQLLSVNEISEIYLKSIQSSWDAYPCLNASIDKLDFKKVENFIQKVNNNGRFNLPENVEAALHKLRLINENIPVNAAMLLFSKEDLFHNVHVGRFKTPSMIIDDKIFSGNLFDVAEKTIQYIIGQIKVAFEIKGQTTKRNEIFEYPIPALRELVLNAIVHRDYTSPTDIQIKIFDQGISFFNPGKLYGGITIEQLKTDKYQSHTRNKILAEAFYLTKDIEKYGSGFIRIRNEIMDYPTMVFEYKEMGDGFLAELKYKKQKITTKFIPEDVTDNVTDNVTDRKTLILNMIIKDNTISTTEIAKQLGVSKRTILRELELLKTAQKLKRVGSEKTGHWEVLS